MASSIESLWPAQIRAKVQSPWAILHTQAEVLGKLTGGLLRGDIKRRDGDDRQVVLTFDIVVPSLDDFRHRVLSVVHGREMLYPAVLEAEIFRPARKSINEILLNATQIYAAIQSGPVDDAQKPVNRADDDEELTELVAKVLQSRPVVSAAQSLIARASEATMEKERLAGALPEPSIRDLPEKLSSTGEHEEPA